MTADGFSLTKSELMPEPANEAKEPQTLGGSLFNAVHNALSPSALLTARQKSERAQHSDQLATVAADTVAMLPGLRVSAASLLRATALMRVSGDWSQFAGSYATDFVAGAALNRVSAACLPEGAVAKRIETQFGKGLVSESLIFASAGAGMGSISTAFRPETWLDESKNFSAWRGGLEVLKGGAAGGIMSAPAGLLAGRISRAGIALAAEGRISGGTAIAIAGVGSGYFSGAVLGGVQGALNGGDFSSIVKGANEGGLTGALSGAIGMSALARLQKLEPQRQAVSKVEEKLPLENAAKNSIVKEPPEQLQRSPGSEQQNEVDLWKSLEIKAAKLNDSESSLKDRVWKLGSPGQARMQYWVAAEHAEQIAAASKSFEEFRLNGGMKPVEDNVRIYSVDGVGISIPETYAKKLDDVLALRLKAAEDPQLYTKGPGYAKEVLQAQLDLEAHPLKDRAHPADFVQLIGELPDRSIVKDVFIREDRAPSDAWNAKEYESGFRAAATAGKEDGRITMYGQNRSPLLREYMKHEYGHLLKWTATTESQRFDQAAALEKEGYFVSKYSRRNNDENWAEHSASLLDRDPDKFLETAHGAPLRTVEMGRALMRALITAGGARGGSHQSEIAARLNYIQQEILPEAQAKLVGEIQQGSKENAVVAAGLLSRIAGDKEFNFLSELALSHESPELRQASFKAAWDKLTLRNSAGYAGEVASGNHNEMREFLIEQAAPGGKSRETALDLLSRMRDNKSRVYYDLFTMDRFSGNKLSLALDLMERAPDAASQKAAWQEALKLSGNNADERVNLALRALDRHPRLISEVVDILAAEAQPRTRPFLRDLTSHYNERIAKRAAQGLQQIDRDLRLQELSGKLQSANENERISAAGALAAGKDIRAVSVILDAYLNSQSATERAALSKAMKDRITPEIWKFELRRKMLEKPQSRKTLEQLMR